MFCCLNILPAPLQVYVHLVVEFIFNLLYNNNNKKRHEISTGLSYLWFQKCQVHACCICLPQFCFKICNQLSPCSPYLIQGIIIKVTVKRKNNSTCRSEDLMLLHNRRDISKLGLFFFYFKIFKLIELASPHGSKLQ